MKKLLIITLLPAFSFGMDMQEAVNVALENNLEIKQEKVNLKKAQIQLKEDKNLFMPEFFLNFSFTFQKDTPYTKIPAGVLPFPLSFKQTEKDFRYFDVGINYPIFTGFSRIEKLKISRLDIDTAKYMLSEKENHITALTKKAYLDVLMAKSLVEIYKKQLTAVEKHLERVRAFFKEGLVARIDILQTKVRLSQVKRDLRKSEGEFKIALERLKNILNVKDSFPVEPVNVNIPESLNLQSLIEKAYKNRTIIKAIDTKLEQLQGYERIERSPFLPKIFAQAKYFYTDQYPYLDPKENYAVSVGLSWKFQGIKPYYASLKVKQDYRKMRLKLQQLKNDIRFQVKAAYEKYLTARENLKVAEDSLSEAEEYYRMTVEQFNNQLATTTDVLDAESMLTAARKGKEISYYQLIKAFVDLEEAVGGSIR